MFFKLNKFKDLYFSEIWMKCFLFVSTCLKDKSYTQ